MPEFSVIVPVYNGEQYLAESVDSVLGQGFRDWEMILVDDGSKDRTPIICDQYAEKDKRIRCIHKTNEGVAIARKTGLEEAIGRYIVFLDGDDWLAEECLEKVEGVIRNQQPDIVSFGHVDELPDGSSRNVPWDFHGTYTREGIERDFFPCLIHDAKAYYYPYNLWRNAIGRDVLMGHMIADSRATIGEDGACMIPTVYQAQKIVFLDECYYHYRTNLASASRGGKVIPWDNARVIAEHISRCIDLNQRDFREQLDRKIVHDVFLICVSRFNAGKGYQETKKEIIRETGRDDYWNAICEAKFSGNMKATLMQFALRHRLVFLMKLYSGK